MASPFPVYSTRYSVDTRIAQRLRWSVVPGPWGCWQAWTPPPGPSTPISAHLGAASYIAGCASPALSLDTPADPGWGTLLAVPGAVAVPLPAPAPPDASAPVGWHPAGEGSACAGDGLPSLLAGEASFSVSSERREHC